MALMTELHPGELVDVAIRASHDETGWYRDRGLTFGGASMDVTGLVGFRGGNIEFKKF